jgi:hypothetical protein
MVDRGWPAAIAFILSACSFDSGGVSDDMGDDMPDGPPGDRDGDGMSDGDDNCPDDPNPEQEDEDADDLGNVCDNCPHVGNAEQTNDGEVTAGAARDGAGDACDPYPSAGGNDILFFDGFDDPSTLDDWTAHVLGNWTISEGRLHQDNNGAAATWLYLRTRQFADLVIDTEADVQSFSPGGGGIGTLAAFASAPDDGAGYLCVNAYNTGDVDSSILSVVKLRGSSSRQVLASMPLGSELTLGTYALRQTLADGQIDCSLQWTASGSASGNDTAYQSGFIGLRTEFAAVDFPYVVVFSVGE